MTVITGLLPRVHICPPESPSIRKVWVPVTLVVTLVMAKLVYRPTGAQQKIASLLPRGLGAPKQLTDSDK